MERKIGGIKKWKYQNNILRDVNTTLLEVPEQDQQRRKQRRSSSSLVPSLSLHFCNGAGTCIQVKLKLKLGRIIMNIMQRYIIMKCPHVLTKKIVLFCFALNGLNLKSEILSSNSTSE